MTGRHPTAEQLAALAPLARLPRSRLDELARLSLIEQAPRGADPLTDRPPGRPMFLVRGEVLLAFHGGGTLVVVGGTGEACRPLNRGRQVITRSKAITDVELLALDDDFLDVLAAWDQAVHDDARLLDSAFALKSLKEGALAELPVGHVEELIKRSERAHVRRAEVVVREGEQGDDCYLVMAGRFQVERMVGGAKLVLAELKSGDAFGEEALVSEAKRNATVTALTDGELLRARRADFNQFLREPLLRRVGFEEALRKVAAGALWLDVRYPSEYQYDKIPGAINVPLAEVRNVFAVLDRSREYVAYCQSGRRSAAAAFLFAQRGFRVWLLEGGLKQAAERRS
ncbi:MAG: cyclic nucleotide-binding domain-containing protein [Burkholderiales bacterium]